MTIAVTGNIGSGKSYIADILQHMGYPVYNADREASKLMNDPEVIMHIIDRFGLEILTQDGLPDRKKIAAIVFNDPASLQWLNHIIHPRVMSHWQTWLKNQQPAEFYFMESAIVFENHLQQYFDGVMLVEAPENVAIQRVMLRDSVTREAVLARLGNQWSYEQKRSLADVTILNDNEKMLLPQIIEGLEHLRQKAV